MSMGEGSGLLGVSTKVSGSNGGGQCLEEYTCGIGVEWLGELVKVLNGALTQKYLTRG